MGLQAKRDFTDINFSRSLMIGDSETDMIFAERLGMSRIFVRNAQPVPHNTTLIFKSLNDVPL